jgi:hypothetical protein
MISMTTLPFWRFGKNRTHRDRILRVVLFSILLGVLIGPLSADLVLRNNTRGILYFLLLPMGVEGTIPWAENAEAAKTYLKEHRNELEKIPPETFLKVRKDPSPYLLLGFYVSPERPSFPLVRVRIPSVPGEPSFTVSDVDLWKSSAGESLVLYPWDIELPRTPIQIDNRYLDWRKIKELRQFPTSFLPPKVLRHRGGSPERIRFDQAKTWPSKGTAVEGLKILRGQREVHFMISTYSPMEVGTSYWFYLLPLSSPTGLALEIPIMGKGGPILLWVPGMEKPTQIGTYVSDLFVLEGELLGSYLPAEAEPLLRQVSKVWMSVSVPTAEGTEEYYLTEFDVTDIPYESGVSP